MKRIAIRLDAGKSIGIGHLMRCMALAEGLQREEDVSVFFICRNRISIEEPYQVVYLDIPYPMAEGGYAVPSIRDEIEELAKVLSEYRIDCLIVDHYGADDNYFQCIRGAVPCLVCIDDSVNRYIPADIMINGNIYGTEAEYGSVPVQLLGGKYTLLRREFTGLSGRRLRQQIEDVYITSGGSDPLRFCERIAAALREKFDNIRIHVIAGAGFERDYVQDLKDTGVTVHTDANMLQCMQDADLFISGAGSTLYELAVTGTPSISYILADNQIRIAERMWKENCSAAGGGWEEFNSERLSAIFHNISDYETRRRMSERAQKTIHSDGALYAAAQIVSFLNGEGGE